MPVKNRFAELLPEITAWRRDLHEHPELQFDLHRTSAVVAEKLREFGCDEVVTGLAKTGVVGVIRGRATASGKVIGLRADMDALPLTEASGVEYPSKNQGVMHACGHDGHTTMLLGAAKYLAETRNFDGTAVVIFQPAEEGGAGAKVMLDDGLLERFGIQEFYGMHNWPGLPVGQFAIRPGPFFAATDNFEITITGRGGHAAKPHENIDPVVVMAQLVLAFQSIVSRNADPVDQLVISVTSVETSSKAFNVIPPRVVLRGTVRTLSKEMRELARARMEALCETLPAGFGATATAQWRSQGYPAMVNSPAETEFAAEVARAVSGDCAEADLVMGGEDFAYLLEARPGAYILVGNGPSASLHSPEYTFDDEAMPAGCSWFAEVVERRMPA